MHSRQVQSAEWFSDSTSAGAAADAHSTASRPNKTDNRERSGGEERLLLDAPSRSLALCVYNTSQPRGADYSHVFLVTGTYRLIRLTCDIFTHMLRKFLASEVVGISPLPHPD